MGVIRSGIRFVKSIGYFLIGKIDRKRSKVSRTPDAIRGGFNEVIRNESKLCVQYIDSTGEKIKSKERKVVRLQTYLKSLEDLREKQHGALSLAQKRAKELETKDPAVLEQDERYTKLRNIYSEKDSLITNLESTIAELEADIKDDERDIEEHKTRIGEMRNNLINLAAERDDTVATVLAAEADRKVNEAFANLPSDNKNTELLQHLREVRESAKASSQVVRELAEIDANSIDEELVKEGRSSVSDNRFDELITGSSNSGETNNLDLGMVDADEVVESKATT